MLVPAEYTPLKLSRQAEKFLINMLVKTFRRFDREVRWTVVNNVVFPKHSLLVFFGWNKRHNRKHTWHTMWRR